MIRKPLKESLQALLEAIEKADGDQIRAQLDRLDQLTRDHGRELDPHLVHFLQRRSYQKALAFLEGERDIPPGLCGGIKK
ncbi:MAG TPA: hypothetical protein VK041_08375 [Opitutales bacterium]|nr:hypothetical protein [Opitutales bacterium]